jgi:hypothetical protein
MKMKRGARRPRFILRFGVFIFRTEKRPFAAKARQGKAAKSQRNSKWSSKRGRNETKKEPEAVIAASGSFLG